MNAIRSALQALWHSLDYRNIISLNENKCWCISHPFEGSLGVFPTHISNIYRIVRQCCYRKAVLPFFLSTINILILFSVPVGGISAISPTIPFPMTFQNRCYLCLISLLVHNAAPPFFLLHDKL